MVNSNVTAKADPAPTFVKGKELPEGTATK